MTIMEAIKSRHTVRKYTNRHIPQEIVSLLIERIKQNNEKYNIDMNLVTENTDAFNTFIKLVLAKGVNNYIVLAGTILDDLDEKLGYCGTDVMLYAQTLGLNTWWVGGTFSKKGVKKNIALTENKKITGIIAVGYGATQGVSHKSKKIEDISYYKGITPDWFINGVKAVLLAPTALNKQAFKIIGEGNRVSITCNNGIFSNTDIGIGKYHFEIGAGKDNFVWN